MNSELNVKSAEVMFTGENSFLCRVVRLRKAVSWGGTMERVDGPEQSAGGCEMTTRTVRKIVRIDEDKCTGCGLCTSACAEGRWPLWMVKPD